MTNQDQYESGDYSLEERIAAEIAAKSIPTAQVINGDVKYGDWIIVRPDDRYSCLVGQVTAIDKLGSDEHNTDNPGDDIHVNFAALEYPENLKAELLEALDGLYPNAASFNDIPLDDVIMAPESLISLTGLDFDHIGELSVSYNAAREFGNSVLTENFDGLEQRLIARVEQNYTDFNLSLLLLSKQDIIDKSAQIHATSDAWSYMTSYHAYSDEELLFYSQFDNPLEVVADAWHKQKIDLEDMSAAMDFVFEQKETHLMQYALVTDGDTDSRRFMGVDLIDFLGKIAGKVIVHNPEDWQSQRNALYRIADTDNPENKRLMWLVSSRGANMYSEQAMFIKGTPAYDKCVDIFPIDSDTFGYIVEVTGKNGDAVIGNVFDVGDYYPYTLHVKENALICTEVSLTYSNDWGVNAGKTVMVPRFEYDDDRRRLMNESGNVTAIQYHPYEVIKTMADVLQQERSLRMAYPIGNGAAHLKSLSEKLDEIRQPFGREKLVPPQEKSAFDKALNRGKEKTEAYKAQKAQDPVNQKNKQEVIE